MRLAFASLVLSLAVSPMAAAQEAATGNKLEVIVSASGEPMSPWVFRQLCQKSNGRCALALMNPATGEVARMGGNLGTDFEFTGNGQELRRAETALDRAIRLKATSN
jgi:predicted transglutaminase-like cysteine proteinase